MLAWLVVQYTSSKQALNTTNRPSVVRVLDPVDYAMVVSFVSLLSLFLLLCTAHDFREATVRNLNDADGTNLDPDFQRPRQPSSTEPKSSKKYMCAFMTSAFICETVVHFLVNG